MASPGIEPGALLGRGRNRCSANLSGRCSPKSWNPRLLKVWINDEQAMGRSRTCRPRKQHEASNRWPKQTARSGYPTSLRN